MYFDWRRDEFPERNYSSGRQIGFIAQEVEAVLPELVSEDGDGYKAMDYAKLTALLVEAVKEQQGVIEAQRADLAALQAAVARLEGLVMGEGNAETAVAVRD